MSCDCNGTTPTNCGNPCQTSETNTAACESLPSQIQNFTDQFFGTVVKTDVNGNVSWSLPCDLEIGLENNPRAEGEGLACYFLRLFSEGIIGATGPQGDAGADGADGHNAFTVTMASFTQPTLGAPNVTVQTSYNPAILEGTYVFISTSGWYLVNGTDGSGALFLTLTKELSGASGAITAGKLVVPSGYPGQSVTGAKGDKGDQGDQGDPGESLTENNGLYYAPVGVDYALQVAYDAINFTNSSPQALLTEAGKYLVTVIIDVKGKGTVTPSDVVAIKLRNTSDSSDILGSEHSKSGIAVDQFEQIVINTIVETDGANQTIAVYGKCTTAGAVDAVAANSTLTFVRVE